MRRMIVLGALLLAGALSVVGVAGQQGQMNIEVDRLEDNLFVLRGEGGGGNTAVFVTTTGVVVVDSKNPGWGQPILDQIKTLTSNPVTTLINTHSHGDHVSGNVAFPTTVEIVTHETTRANMEAMRALHRANGATRKRVQGLQRPGTPDTDLYGSDVARQWCRSGGPVLFRPRTHRR